ncbi:type I-B CRISPR-associated protein Cas5b [uncultured Clostridium sp.]|uniref:type I-B CRISPR-associated protein Cas5b n=1 Tax=uncultured Clostridium sp. TaxID=59620 RepID=UPI00261C926A|nr:type I-B CRISPR-associated protein Cas5b [uncultured Clostridium sp.]
MKCLCFDIFGDYGHFRKFYTTSSPLTFSMPPRTAICGILSAIIGLDKEEYLKHFSKDKAKIAVQINNPIKKTRVSYNLINTKTAKFYSEIKDRTRVTFELLKNPSFRIYINHCDDYIYNKIKTFIENKSNYYTISLGLSQFIADFNYVDEYNFSLIDNNEDLVEINSVLKFYEDMEIEIESDKEYFTDTMPNEMNIDRVVTEYSKVLFERTGKSIKCITDYYENEEGVKIVFL